MDIDWIEPGVLAASGIPCHARDVESLHAQGIRSIVSLTEHPITTMPKIKPALFERLDIVYLHAPVDDHEPPSMEQARTIAQHIAAMREQGRPTLIHCHAGVGRTGTLLHVFFLAQGLSLDEAQAKVRRAAGERICYVNPHTARIFKAIR
jgi:atypical dual specificity phosphatase